MSNQHHMTLIEQIKELMKGKGITQKDLAKKTSINESLISQYFNNKNVMSVEKAEQIADALDCLLRYVQK